jgi:hypothetical protein
MTIHDEFLEILRVLVETPPPAGKKPPSAEGAKTPDVSDASRRRRGDDNCQGAGS